jgi:hypothetical protein
MTQQEFFAVTQLHPDRVNIWYDDTGGPPYTFKAITVPALDNSVPPQDQSTLLDSIQQITVPTTAGTPLTFNIISRTSAQTSTTAVMPSTKYYYFTITPLVINSAWTPTIGATSISTNEVIFAPSLDTYQLSESPYNVLQGSFELGRQSGYIMSADRYKVGTLANPTYTGPLNIDSLLSGSAIKADVQDSNYTTTGWINGRYEGTKTDRIDYKTEPAITGKFFQASEFPSGSSMGQINYLISSSQVSYGEYFYAGIGDTPGFQAEYSGYLPLTSYATNSDIIAIVPEVAGSNLRAPQGGDLFRQVGSTEIIRVNTVAIASIAPLKYNLFVSRGYFGQPQPINAGSSTTFLERIKQVQVYSTEKGRLSGVPRGQLLVKETGAILRLDSLGFVISST